MSPSAVADLAVEENSPDLHVLLSVKSIYPLCFWKVRDREPEAHILGSIHYVSPGTYPLPDHIEAVIDRAEVAMFEGKTATTSRATYVRNMYNEPIAQRLAAHPELLARLQRAADAYRVDLADMDDYSLWFVAYSIHDASMEGLGKPMSDGVDSYIRGRCKDRATFEFLETGDEMVAGLTDMSPAGQISFVQSLLDEVEERVSDNPDKVEREWRSGNLQYFAKGNVDEARKYPERYQALHTSRNIIWIDNIQRALEQGKRTLIVGGAAHFVGENSVPQLLKKKFGTRVDQVKSWR